MKDPAPGMSRAEVQTENLRMRAAFPPKKMNGDRTLLGTGISYEQVHFNYRNWDPAIEPARVDTVYAIQAQLFLRQKLDAKYWYLRTFVSAGFNSDFKSVTLQAARAQGGLLWEREVESGNVTVGLVVLDDYGRTRLFPAIGIEQTFGGRHKIILRAPTLLAYTYTLNDRWELGAIARVAGTNARLEEEGIFKGKNLSYSLATIGPAARVKITKSVALGAEVGWTLRHTFQILDGRDTFRDYDLKNSYFASVALRILR